MNLYLVSRWGNDQDEEGPDGEDTNFLVCASSVQEASEFIDAVLKKTAGGNVSSFCQRVTRIGESLSRQGKATIILGPVIAPAIMHDDKGIDDCERWARDEEGNKWVRFDGYFEN